MQEASGADSPKLSFAAAWEYVDARSSAWPALHAMRSTRAVPSANSHCKDLRGVSGRASGFCEWLHLLTMRSNLVPKPLRAEATTAYLRRVGMSWVWVQGAYFLTTGSWASILRKTARAVGAACCLAYGSSGFIQPKGIPLTIPAEAP